MGTAAPSPGEGRSVLVVDDDEVLRRTLGRMLRRAGIAYQSADGGAQALRMLESGQFDVVVTDYSMPGMDGAELVRRAKQGDGAEVEFVLLSGVERLDMHHFDSRGGIFCALRKPVDERELTQAIESARELQRRRKQATPEMSVLLLEQEHEHAARLLDEAMRLPGVANVVRCATLDEATRMASQHHFDVAVIDPTTADARGVDALRELRVASPSTALVFLGDEDDEVFAEQLLSMGVQDCLLRDRCSGAQLEIALRRAFARKQAEQRLVHVATHDPLTNLVNAHALRSTLRMRAARGLSSHQGLALLYLDLDGFKDVNDRLGHAAGDEVLQHVSDCLQAHTREGDVAARLGGDEFALLLGNVVDSDSVARIGERLVAAIDQPLRLSDGHIVRVSASVGVALFPHSARDGMTLLRLADQAMYAAKSEGPGHIRFAQALHHAPVVMQSRVEQRLREAVGAHQFALVSQPQKPLRGDRPITGEVLLRWPAEPDLSPSEFVPWLERLGLMQQVTEWCLHQVAAVLARCQREGDEQRLSLNIAAREFVSPEFPHTVETVLRQHGVEPSRLVLEVAARDVPQDDPAFHATLDTLRRKMGVRVIVDNYGADDSSLSTLRRYRFDGIKLHRSYVTPVASEKEASVFARGIVQLAHGMGLDVVAEGVETSAQLEALREVGCDAAQGFWVGHPRPLA